MSGASEKAIEAAATEAAWLSAEASITSVEEARRILAAAHDPALGLDRSVCARSFIRWLGSRDVERVLGFRLTEIELERLEREFARGGS